MIKTNTFGKEERITSEIVIQDLFKNGKSEFVYPLKCVYRSKIQAEGKVKILISVPKRNFKKAVDRNRLKRLMRDTYRISKHSLIGKSMKSKTAIDLAFIYVAKEKTEFNKMLTSMERIINKILLVINSSN